MSQAEEWQSISAKDFCEQEIKPSLNPIWTDKQLRTADERANRGKGHTSAGVDTVFADFKTLGAKFDKYQLAEFIKANSAEPELVAELLDEHYRPRTTNENGCTCRFEDGEACSLCGSWHRLFHGDEEVLNAPPITFAIDGFLQNDAITMIGGLPGHGKTWVMLSMVKALLEGAPLFGYDGFKVTEKASKVVYLCPESSLTPFAHRLKLF
jgi:AAA domain